METNLKENKKYMSKIGLIYLLGTALIFGLQYLFMWLFGKYADESLSQYAFLVQMLPMYAIAIPAIVFAVKKIPVEVKTEKSKLSVLQFIAAFLVAYASMILFNLFGNILASFIGMIKHSEVQNGILQIATSNNLVVNFIVMVICAPIAEELIFRKLLIDRTRKFGDKFAIILSAFMFGFFHGNIYQFCYASALGFIFGYVYCKTSNIKYTIVLHMIINFMGSILGIIVLRYSGVLDMMNSGLGQAEMQAAFMKNIPGLCVYLIYMFLIFAMVIAGIIIFCVNVKKLKFASGIVELAKGERFQTMVVNPGMALFVIFWIGYIIYMTVI